MTRTALPDYPFPRWGALAFIELPDARNQRKGGAATDGIGLEDALAICLALLDREPQTYPRAAAKWASRFALERRLTLIDTQLTLAALAALPGESARAGVEALIELAERYRLRRVDELLTSWMDRRATASATRNGPSESGAPD